MIERHLRDVSQSQPCSFEVFKLVRSAHTLARKVVSGSSQSCGSVPFPQPANGEDPTKLL
jgi:hypothetical protein